MKTLLIMTAIIVMAVSIPTAVYQTVLILGCVGMLISLAIYIWTGQ
jgi:hypothetical protein